MMSLAKKRLDISEDDGMTDAVYVDAICNEYERDFPGSLSGWVGNIPDSTKLYFSHLC